MERTPAQTVPAELCSKGRRDVRLGPPQAEGHDAIRLAKLHIIGLASRRIDIAQPLLRPVSMAYIVNMLWRVRTPRGRPNNAPAAFIPPCRPIVAEQPPRGPGWAHELKHDGYRLQVHVRDGRVRLYTMNGADWSKRYPLIARRPRGSRALPSSTPKWSACLRRAFPTSTPCTVAPWITPRSRSASICSCATGTICGGVRWSSARRR